MKRKATLAAIAGVLLTTGAALTAAASAASAAANGPQPLSSFGYEVVPSNGTQSLAPGQFGSAFAVCPKGKRPVGGGSVVTDNRGQNLFDVLIASSHPQGITWQVTGKNTSSSQGEFLGAVAVCASV